MRRLGQSIHNYPNCIMFPLGEGKPDMKSIVMLSRFHWGIGRGFNKPDGAWSSASPPVVLFHILVHLITSKVHGENSIVAFI